LHPRFHTSFALEPGASRTVTKFARYKVAEGDAGALLPDAGTRFEDFASASAAEWAGRWESSAIEVGGDREAERALRFAAFHLIAGSPAQETSGSIGARLLSGPGYRHHVFWDTDVYVIPYLTVTQPDLARTHLAYRFRGLPAARRKAKKHGREGAFYAWESADTGDEVTPKWGHMPDGKRIRIWTGELQEHITAVVAWAVDHYWSWTGDDRFMADQGAEMMLDGARYWSSRLESEDGLAHIRDVIGPNEYHIHIDDSLFTNAMAAWHLRTAAEAIEWLGGEDPGRLAGLMDSRSLQSSTAADFRELADRVALPRSDTGIWEEHAGFFDLEEIDLQSFQPCSVSLQGLLGEERVQQIRLVKQADVIMAMVMLEELRTPGALEANFDFYAPITDHGSSLSLAMHSLAASMIGRPGRAYDYFRSAVAIDHDDAMGRDGQGIHAATQGGILQAALFGFGGLALGDGTPTTIGRLPDHWDSLGFSFVHRGTMYEFEAGQGARSGVLPIGEAKKRRKGT
jgi:kojibiose phosphorylase